MGLVREERGREHGGEREWREGRERREREWRGERGGRRDGNDSEHRRVIHKHVVYIY